MARLTRTCGTMTSRCGSTPRAGSGNNARPALHGPWKVLVAAWQRITSNTLPPVPLAIQVNMIDSVTTHTRKAGNGKTG